MKIYQQMLISIYIYIKIFLVIPYKNKTRKNTVTVKSIRSTNFQHNSLKFYSVRDIFF